MHSKDGVLGAGCSGNVNITMTFEISMKKIILAMVMFVSLFAKSETFYDVEATWFNDSSGDEWDDGVELINNQKSYHGYRIYYDVHGFPINDIPSSAWTAKKIKPFYLQERRLNGIIRTM